MNAPTRQVADFAAGLTPAAIPETVAARAKGIILDGLGCALYASDVAWIRMLSRVVRKMDTHGGQATVWGRSEAASAVNAALLNGTMVQGYELDDTHLDASFHACAAVLPSAFAAAEYIGAQSVSGAQLLTAIIAGFEVGPRVGLCMNGEKMIIKGWHAPAVISAFPAAAAAGRILRLGAEQIFHALGIAGTQACGLMAAQYGSMVKRMQCAKNSQGGLLGALLAAEGFTGIENIFEEQYGGYCSTFTNSTDQYDLTRLTRGLGDTWETLRISIKTYACRGGNQSGVAAIDELLRETDFGAADVDEINVGVTEGMVKHSGWKPYLPKGLTAAQMHLGFCIATRIIEGDVFIDQMTDANIGRPDLVALANRVNVVRSVERESMGKEFRKGCDVEVKLRDGRVLRRTVDFCPGSENNPLTRDQIAAKFRRLTARAMPAKQAERLENMIWELDRMPSIAPLMEALKGNA